MLRAGPDCGHQHQEQQLRHSHPQRYPGSQFSQILYNIDSLTTEVETATEITPAMRNIHSEGY